MFSPFHSGIPTAGFAPVAGPRFTGQVMADDGGAPSPAYGFSTASTTGLFRAPDGGLALSIGGVERLRLDASGNLLVGRQGSSSHALYRDVVEGGRILTSYGSDQTAALEIYAVAQEGYNSAAAAMLIGRNSLTGRSLNAGGSLNVQGSDYAEYEVKRADCGPIAKGDVCGFDAEGYLTDRWSQAVSFAVKSTQPGYVGGDDWAVELAGAGAAGDDPGFQDRYEAMRTRVDRIAYCGKVPVTMAPGNPGDLVIAVEREGDRIGALAVSPDDYEPALEPYRIGRIRRILSPQQCLIMVMLS
ncbi:hypothetical protein [Niveispirillum irakense]|uniref:hypothetical protein n=1 Tax=Niveispirillum irakense TaxID=34011 RepID=UPI0004087CD2|nr:hypothetical protein [Niveispirillum irakense]